MTAGRNGEATVWFILEELRQRQAGGLCLLLGFGPGLVCEAALLDLPVA